MTWDHTRDLPWAKVYDAWFSSPSHIDLDIVTLGIGIRCMQLANRRGRQPDGSGALVNGAGAAMSLVGLAREAHATPEQVAAALDQLVAVGTMQKRGDVYVFPHLQRWQEDPSAERQRRHRGKGESVTVTPNVTATVTAASRTDDRRKKEEERSSERDPDPERAHTDRPQVAPEPNPPEAPQRSPEPSAPPSQRREPDGAPQGQPGASDAKVASSSESIPLVEAELEEKPPLRAVPAAVAFEDFDDDLLDDTTGAAEAIGAWNDHRADEIPPSPTNARGLSSAVLTTIRADRRAEREARERGDVSPPAVPWLHRRSGWVAFAERTRSAAFVRQRMRKTAELAWWVHEANRGGESGAMRRERLFAGAWDELRSGAETAMERNVREAFDRARGDADRADDEPAWAAMLTAGSGAAAVKRR